MTSRAKFTANENREELFASVHYRCQVCGLPLTWFGTPQLAHRIAQSKANLKRFGEAVIHHKLNLVPVCSLKCNDACNIGFNAVAANSLAESITTSKEA